MECASLGQSAKEEVQLLNFWGSPYGMRVVLALEAKGVPYTTIDEELGPDDKKSPLLLQSNPVYKKVPVLLHKGRPICESLIICRYVDEAFPSAKHHHLLPTDPFLRASALFWADFCDKKVFESFFRPMMVPREEFGSAMEECKKHFATLEGAFKDDGPFFGGYELGFVDLVLGPLVPCLPALEVVTKAKWEFDQFPRLQAWIKAFSECPMAHLLPDPSKVTEAAKALRQSRFPQNP